MFHQAATTLLALALAGTALASPLHPLPPQARQDAAAAAPTAAIPADAEAAAAAANTAAKGGAQIFAGDTQNGLTTASGATNCAQTIVIFARGTTETGNVGTLTGPPFFQALAAAVGAGGNDNKLAVQGVDYAAAIAGFLAGGDPAGSKLMAQLAQKAVGDCPSSKVVISGYSQGGQLVHNAAAMLPADVSGKLAGAVIFGDPLNGKPVQGVAADKTKIICHAGDNICQGGALVLAPHLTYSQDAGAAAQFVVGL